MSTKRLKEFSLNAHASPDNIFPDTQTSNAHFACPFFHTTRIKTMKLHRIILLSLIFLALSGCAAYNTTKDGLISAWDYTKSSVSVSPSDSISTVSIFMKDGALLTENEVVSYCLVDSAKSGVVILKGEAPQCEGTKKLQKMDINVTHSLGEGQDQTVSEVVRSVAYTAIVGNRMTELEYGGQNEVAKYVISVTNDTLKQRKMYSQVFALNITLSPPSEVKVSRLGRQ